MAQQYVRESNNQTYWTATRNAMIGTLPSSKGSLASSPCSGGAGETVGTLLPPSVTPMREEFKTRPELQTEKQIEQIKLILAEYPEFNYHPRPSLESKEIWLFIPKLKGYLGLHLPFSIFSLPCSILLTLLVSGPLLNPPFPPTFQMHAGPSHANPATTAPHPGNLTLDIPTT